MNIDYMPSRLFPTTFCIEDIPRNLIYETDIPGLKGFLPESYLRERVSQEDLSRAKVGTTCTSVGLYFFVWALRNDARSDGSSCDTDYFLGCDGKVRGFPHLKIDGKRASEKDHSDSEGKINSTISAKENSLLSILGNDVSRSLFGKDTFDSI